ncbi:hypothetical protein COO60DRAFT_1294068 [Scenedesmus sp. NREL 46B-D3]|nr:hypothetical protein COO60DRAFT_1294068 [Scenedesmus sp. NREL 46B-D3]
MRASVVVLSLCMLFTGTINTIATKYQDITVVGTLPDGTPLTFKHPAVQSACMFFGESLCLIPYFYMRWRKRKAKRRNPAYVPMHPDEKRSRRIGRILAFAVPTLCDATGTTLMNVGLIYTYASTYQMLRGTLVLFAGTFTILILRRQLFIHNWLGMVLITAGAALVGASSVIYQDSPGAHNNTLLAGPAAGLSLAEAGAAAAAAPLFGDLLVVAAQMFTALQFIMEEKFLVKYKVPALLAIGLEGCWGLLLCSFVLPVTSLVKGKDGFPLDDAVAAARSIFSNSELGLAVYSSILSIAFFNFFGVSVTKSLSGAARATIDACRTLFIWLYALHAGWEQFHLLQVVGFVVLISGTSLYNEILKSCLPGTTLVTEREHPVQPRRRTRPSTPGSTTAAADSPELSAPLLSSAAGSTAAMPPPVAAAARRPAGAPVPLQRPAPAHDAVYDAAQSAAGSGSWVYTMARSMRLGMHALSPQSLAAVGGGLAGGDDEESGGESDVGSYMSLTPGGGLLAASLGGGEGVSGGAAAVTGLAGRSPVQTGERGNVVIGFGMPNFSRAAGRSSPLAPQQQGGLSASLRMPAGRAAAGAGASGANVAGAGAASGVRRSSSTGGLARSSSSGSIPHMQQPSGGRGGRPPPAH